MYEAKTKALISFVVTANLICVFVFTYAKCWFSHDEAQLDCGYALEPPQCIHNLCFEQK